MGKSRSIPRSRRDFPSNIFCATWGIKSISPILSKNTTNYCQWITNCKKKQIDTNELTCLVFISYLFCNYHVSWGDNYFILCHVFKKCGPLIRYDFFVEKNQPYTFSWSSKESIGAKSFKKVHILNLKPVKKN